MSQPLPLSSNLICYSCITFRFKVRKEILADFYMNDTHRILAYEDDVSLIGDVRTIERNVDVLLNAFQGIGLAVNTGKTKYMEIGRHRGMIANEHIKIGSNSSEKVKTFKYLRSLLINHNSIQEEMKCRLKAEN